MKTIKEVEQFTEKFEQVFQNTVQTLEELIQIPSVSVNSTTSEKEAIETSAKYVLELFKKEGVYAQITSAPITSGARAGQTGNPAIIGYKGAGKNGEIDPNKPTVLLYAHHDVQPASSGNWQTDPFTPVQKTINGDLRLYGRGSADDGAGIALHLGVLKLYNQLELNLPVNVKIFIEGEEECGSPSFTNFIESHQKELQADVIIVADSGNWAVGVPAITTTLRGVVSIDLSLKVLEHSIHSGMSSGPIIDANSLLMKTIVSLWDEKGNLVVEGLKGAKGFETPEPEVDWTFGEFKKDTSLLDGVELSGEGTISGRVWNKPSVTVIGFDATPINRSSNVFAPSAKARISVRLHPEQDPRLGGEAVIEHLKKHVPFSAHFDAQIIECGGGFSADLTTDGVTKLAAALSEGFENTVVYSGMGGSIPFVNDLKKTFPKADVLLVGVEDPDSRAHSNDESVSLVDLKKVILSGSLLLEKLADI